MTIMMFLLIIIFIIFKIHKFLSDFFFFFGGGKKKGIRRIYVSDSNAFGGTVTLLVSLLHIRSKLLYATGVF